MALKAFKRNEHPSPFFRKITICRHTDVSTYVDNIQDLLKKPDRKNLSRDSETRTPLWMSVRSHFTMRKWVYADIIKLEVSAHLTKKGAFPRA